MKTSTTHDLHAVVLLSQHAPRSLAGSRKGFEENVVQRLLVLLHALFQFVRLGTQFFVGEPGVLIF